MSVTTLVPKANCRRAAPRSTSMGHRSSRPPRHRKWRRRRQRPIHRLPEPLRADGTMSEPILLIERRDGVVTITLNRPHALNALSRALRAALAETFRSLQDDPAAGVVILTGAGRAFCAGLDLKEI